MAGRARAISEGWAQPTEAKPAATVVLVRERAGAAQVYLLRRVVSMAFAAGAYVFPGGSVDPPDANPGVRWLGPSPAEWGRVLHTDAESAQALICAAVRETYEESGVLLAGATPHSVVSDVSGEEWEADRQALVNRSVSLADLLARRGLAIRSDLLRPWAHWITPEVEPRRYDTRFFLAALPAGQHTRDAEGEADRAVWTTPVEALEAFRRGDMYMLPPTVVTLAEIHQLGSVSQILATRRTITPVMPEIRLDGDDAWLVIPDGS